jgi:hypothetical protein
MKCKELPARLDQGIAVSTSHKANRHGPTTNTNAPLVLQFTMPINIAAVLTVPSPMMLSDFHSICVEEVRARYQVKHDAIPSFP